MSDEALEKVSGTEAGWDLVIQPRTGWLQLHLADLWRYRDLILLFVRRDFVAVYKQTILGPLWHIIQPLMTTLTFTVIFGRIAQLSTDGLPPFLFYMTGTVIWNYFSNCLTGTSNTFVGNAHIFGKVYFPRLAVPVSIVVSRLISFGIQFALYLAFLAWFAMRGTAVRPDWTLLLLSPLLLLAMAGLGLGFGILISSLTTRYRDLQNLVAFGVQLAMYASPVIYPLSAVPEKHRWLVLLNPMSAIIETFRCALLGAGTFEPLHLAYSFTFTAVILFCGLLIFNRVERTFMDTV